LMALTGLGFVARRRKKPRMLSRADG